MRMRRLGWAAIGARRGPPEDPVGPDIGDVSGRAGSG